MAAVLAGKNVMFAGQAKRKFRVGLIGCGGRGNGALDNCMAAAKIMDVELELVGTADWFKDRAEGTGKRYNLPPAKCFSGATAYKKLLETDADVILMATSPNFRPVHFEAAINAGKHVFMEKPVAVDPPGGRRVIAAGEAGQAEGAGRRRRHAAPARGAAISGRSTPSSEAPSARSPAGPSGGAAAPCGTRRRSPTRATPTT